MIPIEKIEEILTSAKIPLSNPTDDTWCANADFPAKDGWTVTVFYDCGEYDYIDSLKGPNGEELKFPFLEYGDPWNEISCWQPTT